MSSRSITTTVTTSAAVTTTTITRTVTTTKNTTTAMHGGDDDVEESNKNDRLCLSTEIGDKLLSKLVAVLSDEVRATTVTTTVMYTHIMIMHNQT